MMTTSIHSVHVGKPKTLQYNNEKYVSGVDKNHVLEAMLTKEGFIGDEVADKKNHGGLDRAVLMYSFDHYAMWNKEFQTELSLPAFGENITPYGMTEADVHIGDIYQLGEAIIQVTQSRIPCFILSKQNHIDALLSRMVATGYTGYLCRVMQEGVVKQSSTITLLERDPASVSALYCNQIYFHDRDNMEGIRKILAMEALAERWRSKLEERLNN